MSALDLGARPASTTNSAAARGNATPAVSVIVPHFNDLANLRACLALLKAQTLPADDVEIIVADNNSTVGLDAVRAVCGERTVVVNAPIQGAAAARNTGVEASRGRILAFIDSDCRPAPDWLTNGVAALSRWFHSCSAKAESVGLNSQVARPVSVVCNVSRSALLTPSVSE